MSDVETTLQVLGRLRAEGLHSGGEPGPDERVANPVIGLAIRLARLHNFESAVPELERLGAVTTADLNLLDALKRVVAVSEKMPADELLPEPLPDRARDRLAEYVTAEHMSRPRMLMHALPADLKDAVPGLSESDRQAITSLLHERLFATLQAMDEAERQIELDEARARFVAAKVRRALKPAQPLGRRVGACRRPSTVATEAIGAVTNLGQVVEGSQAGGGSRGFAALTGRGLDG